MAYPKLLVFLLGMTFLGLGCKSHSSDPSQSGVSGAPELSPDETLPQANGNSSSEADDKSLESPESEFKDFEITAAENDLPECPVADDWCTDDVPDRILCSASAIDGKPLDEGSNFQAFGKNFCDARKKLFRLGCDRGISPSKLGEIVCIPDPTGGNCPYQPGICTTQFEPMICTARSYDGQPLTEDTTITAKGTNSCRAKENLKTLACLSNLDPKKLEDVECEKDQEAADKK